MCFRQKKKKKKREEELRRKELPTSFIHVKTTH